MESARKAKEYIKQNIKDKAEKEKEAKKKKYGKDVFKPYTKKELEELGVGVEAGEYSEKIYN